MSWMQIKLEGTRETAQLLSEILTETGALSVTLEDGADEPLFQSSTGAVPLWSSTRIVGLYDGDTPVMELVERLQALLTPAELPPYRVDPLEEQDWGRAWMDRFKPMHFGERLWICPTWVEPPSPEAINLFMDPGMAFGTGTHETTALCLEWLDGADLNGCDLIDYGCGSGILAIAAVRLGASRVWAVDIDSQALEVTRENAGRNGVEEHLTIGPAAVLPEGKVDIVIANILARPLMELAPVLAGVVRGGGILVLSGILISQTEAVAAAYREWFDPQLPVNRGDWSLLTARRKRG
ncbi:MAG: 50S ribosomal protein L11 methyltransferase [Gammaproteobacteria bacterium]|nr:50S ribosomal protein L11 methyltransferase [Gammaproteobacteria bacterium]